MVFAKGTPWAANCRGKGKGIAFIRDHVNYQGDDCLPWPLSRNQNGHGQFGYLRQTYLAHRYMCEMVNGPPPSPDHEAAHSCGNGHKGCVNPKHLSWKTREQNQADRYIHNRKPGKGRARFKLTLEQVAEIRSSAGLKTNKELALKFGVSRGCIRQILLRQTWQTEEYTKPGFKKGDMRNPFRRRVA